MHSDVVDLGGSGRVEVQKQRKKMWRKKGGEKKDVWDATSVCASSINWS